MRSVHDLKTGEKAIVFTVVIPVISALVVFFNYDIPEEHLITLIKVIFALFTVMATWKILDLFIFNDKNGNNGGKDEKKKK